MAVAAALLGCGLYILLAGLPGMAFYGNFVLGGVWVYPVESSSFSLLLLLLGLGGLQAIAFC
jgi:hypothetical protein